MSDIDPDREDGSGADDAGPLTNEDVAPMRLRPEPPRVTRLSRKVLIGLGLVTSLGVGGALVYALQSPHRSNQDRELYSTDNRSTPDGLASLPKSYSEVPKLGPPLPGDLGRPIVSAQNAGKAVPAPAIAARNPEIRKDDQARRREAEAARTAKLFAKTDTHPSSARAAFSGNRTGIGTASSQPDLAGLGLAPQSVASSAQDRQVAFLNQAPDKRTVSSDRVTAPASPDILQAGSVIPAALITGIRSDLPGQITAQVTANVYDSPTGKILLIPQGTRVIGQYDNGVGFGQRRVLLVWNRLIFPNGRSIVLERQPGADVQGYAGLEDGVDYHWGSLFKAAVLSTILSVGAEAGTSQNENSLVQAIRSGASNSISQTGQQIVQRQLNVAPTLTIRPGFPVRVIVTHDLVIEPYGG